MLNFKVYWSTLGTYFILVRASTCLVFFIGSSKSFWKVSCGNSVSLVPKIKTTRFQVLIWRELVLYKTPFPGDSHQPYMLGLDAGFPAAPVRPLQWFDGSAGRQEDASNNSQRWNWRLFSLEEVKIRSSSRSKTKSSISRSQKYRENKRTLEDSAFPVGANASLISQHEFSFARELLMFSCKFCKCDKYLSIKLQKAY